MTLQPEQTALQAAHSHQASMMGAVASAVSALELRQAARPASTTVEDAALLAGLRSVATLMPMLIGYAEQVLAQRNELSARVAAIGSDATSATLLSLVSGLSAACTTPGPAGLSTPTLPLIYSTTQAWQAGAEAGWSAHAAFILKRIAARLA